MKKLLVATAVASMAVMGTAMAASVPVTDVSHTMAKVNFDRGFHNSVKGFEGHHNGYSASLQAGISRDWALQYGYTRYKSDDSVSTNELTAVYRVNGLVNVYTSVMNLHMPSEDAKWGYQVGAIGHMPVFPGFEGFARIGVGNKFKNTLQLGVSHKILPNLDIHAYYQHDKLEDHVNIHGYNIGVGLAF